MITQNTIDFASFAKAIGLGAATLIYWKKHRQLPPSRNFDFFDLKAIASEAHDAQEDELSRLACTQMVAGVKELWQWADILNHSAPSPEQKSLAKERLLDFGTDFGCWNWIYSGTLSHPDMQAKAIAGMEKTAAAFADWSRLCRIYADPGQKARCLQQMKGLASTFAEWAEVWDSAIVEEVEGKAEALRNMRRLGRLEHWRDLLRTNATQQQLYRLALAEMPQISHTSFEEWVKLALGQLGYCSEDELEIAVRKVYELREQATYATWQQLFTRVKDKFWSRFNALESMGMSILENMLAASQTFDELVETKRCATIVGALSVANAAQRKLLEFEPLP